MLPLQLGNLLPIASDPVSVLLLLAGNVLLGVAVLVMGYLSLGGVVAALAPE